MIPIIAIGAPTTASNIHTVPTKRTHFTAIVRGSMPNLRALAKRTGFERIDRPNKNRPAAQSKMMST
jgi:hypothetical protein